MDDDKLFYTIGEVARMASVKPYVLRYWETEFEQLRPRKTPTGQRAYRKRDVEVALTIKRLVHDEQFTLAGARKKLEELEKADALQQMDMFPEGGQGTAGTLASPGPEPTDPAWDEVHPWLVAIREILRKYD